MKKTFTLIASVLTAVLSVVWSGSFAQNETCAGALPIACGDVVVSSTAGVANDTGTSGANSCANVGTAGQRWFTYTPTSSETVTLSLCGGGTTYDSRIHVYSGGCGAFTCIGNNDDFCGLQSLFSFTATCGTTYYIRIGGFGAGSGAFSLAMTCLAGGTAGCMDLEACNYEPCALSDNGSCEYTSCSGCTDPGACNFDATATISDNTQCCYGTCATFSMTDLFGDGWNGAVATIYTLPGNTVVGSAGLTSGASGSALFCLDPGCYYIEVTPGTFPGEVGWSLTGVDGGTIAGGAPIDMQVFAVGGADCQPGCMDINATNYDPVATVDDGSCIYCAPGEQLMFFNMVDDFGDGWNGAQYFISDNMGTIIAQGSLNTAANGDGLTFGFDPFCLAPGCYFVTTTSGSFPGEVGWNVSDANGNIILAGDIPNGAPVTNAGFAWAGQTGCSILGCTDPNCNNYNPSANEDDGSCICPPSNDECADAIDIGCGVSVNVTTINANAEVNEGDNCQGIAVTSPGVWYKFIGTGQQITLSTCASSPDGTVTDTKLHVFAGTCNNLVCIAANDDDPNCTLFKSSVTFTSANGVQYFVLASEFGNGIGIDYVLTMECIDCGTPPINDDCSFALPQPSGIPTPGSLCCSNPDDISDCNGFASGNGVWYTMNSGSFDTFDFTLANGDGPGVDANDGTNVGMVVYESDGDCNTLNAIACCPTVADVCAGSLYAANIPVTQNTQYYFLVYTTDPSGCGNFTLTTTLSSIGCTDPAASNYDPTATIDDGSCDYVNPPANDLCADAVPLVCGQLYNGSTGLSTATGAPNTCIGVNSDAGVWYTFVGDGQMVTISTCGSAIDSRIALVSSVNGCNGPFTCIATADDDATDAGCGFFDGDDGVVNFVSTVGTTYYVYIMAGGTDTNGDFVDDLFDGPFTLSFDCAPVIEGCTNDCACNYNASANVDDGSCEYFSCVSCTGTSVMMYMEDSFGDGWNGATYTITDSEGNTVATGGLDASQCNTDNDNFPGPEFGFDILCLEDGCYSIIAGGGTWDGEVSWELQDDQGNIIVSGPADVATSFTIGGAICGCTDPGACNYDPAATDDDGSCEFQTCTGCMDPTACNYDEDATINNEASCCYGSCLTLTMNDSFGDGWNGNTAVITDANTGAIVGTAGLPTGSTATATFCVDPGCYVITVGGGAFAGEVSWILTGINGGLATGGVNNPTGLQFSVGGPEFDCEPGCTEPLACNYDPNAGLSDCSLCEYVSCQGCTYAQATNFNPDALIDDGSCIIEAVSTCPADINGDGIVGVADLVIFIGEFGTTCE